MDKESASDQNKEEISEEQDSQLSIPPEILKEIPEDIRPKISRSLSLFMGSMSMGRFPPTNPLLKKITTSHISKVLDSVEQDDIRQANAHKSIRRYVFWGFIVLVIVALVLVIFLQLQGATEILVNLIIAIFSLAGGFGIGRYFQR